MKILQVVPLISPTGSYGGPITVAMNQSLSLRSRGHDVHIAGAASGYDLPPSEISGLPAHLFAARNLVPGSGFAGLYSIRLQLWFARHHESFDIIHFHLSRSLTTLPLARTARKTGVPYVTQTHGMIDPSRNPLVVPLDALLTRPALKGAAARFVLTQRESDDLAAVLGPSDKLEFLVNGVPDATSESFGENLDNPTIEVLFLARLHKRKRPLMFVDAALRLTASLPNVRFTLVGPDEGEGESVAAAINGNVGRGESAISWEGAVAPAQVLARIAAASIYVLPSIDEPFPMSVLEAMSLGVPVVITDSCGLAPAVREAGAGMVIDESRDALEAAILLLATDTELRKDMGNAARRLATDHFSMSAVADRLEGFYQSSSRGSPTSN